MFGLKRLSLKLELESLRKDVRTIELKLSKTEFQSRRKPLFSNEIHDCIIGAINVSNNRCEYFIKDCHVFDYIYTYDLFNTKTKTIHTDMSESVLINYQENKEQNILNT